MEQEFFGTSAMARKGPCTEQTVRNLDWLLKPARDSSGKRLYTADKVDILRAHLTRPGRIGVRRDDADTSAA